jgi:fumarate hydratase subunit alpha
MKKINTSIITEAVSKMLLECMCNIDSNTVDLLSELEKNEKQELPKFALKTLLENNKLAKEQNIPFCQDTGMAVVFVDIGQEVRIAGGLITDAINEGVRRGYEKGYLRKSVVKDPLKRVNTKDNTPAVIHYEIVAGDVFHLAVVPKGFGSENMSRLKMLNPSQGLQGIKDFVIETVSEAGANPCPPIVVGVGIGGTMEKCACLSKKALLRPVNQQNDNPELAKLETELLESINALGIGVAGFGGNSTALSVSILTYPTHIAGLPVAVNIGCHATRHVGESLY